MDQSATSGQTQKAPMKGSWEALLQEAQSHARNYNEKAIPTYQRVVDGLTKLPNKVLMAGNRRLYSILVTATLELQGFLNTRDRYEESLATLQQFKPFLDEAELEQVDSLEHDIMLLAGRVDEVVDDLQKAAEAEDAELGDWGQIVMAYVRAKQPSLALPVLEKMEKSLEEKIEAGTISEDDAQRDRGYIIGLRTVVALESGDLDKSVSLFDQVIELGGSYANHPHLLYGRLIHNGRYEQALPYIERDKDHPVRASFWRGVAYHHLGDEEKAKRAWNQASTEETVRSDQQSMVEFILSLYYMGDPSASGLEIVLSSMREQQAPAWILFYLAAIGWKLRGDPSNARSNMRLAATQYKWTAEGHKLPYQYWFFVTDLLPDESQSEFTKYFFTEPRIDADDGDQSS